jgi:hypothetical protein
MSSGFPVTDPATDPVTDPVTDGKVARSFDDVASGLHNVRSQETSAERRSQSREMTVPSPMGVITPTSRQTSIQTHIQLSRSESPKLVLEYQLKNQQLMRELATSQARNKDLVTQILTMSPNYEKIKLRLKEQMSQYKADVDELLTMQKLEHEQSVGLFKATIAELETVNRQLHAEIREVKEHNEFLESQVADLTATVSNLEQSMLQLVTVSKHENLSLKARVKEAEDGLALFKQNQVDANRDKQCLQEICDMFAYVRHTIANEFKAYKLSLDSDDKRTQANKLFSGTTVFDSLSLDESSMEFDTLSLSDKKRKQDAKKVSEQLLNRLNFDADSVMRLRDAVQNRNDAVHGKIDRRKFFNDDAKMKVFLQSVQTSLHSVDTSHVASFAIKDDAESVITAVLSCL